MKLVIHPATARQLDAFAAAPSHAVMLIGPVGSGKAALAQQLAARVLDVADFSKYPYQRVVTTEENSSIGIEAVRELEAFLKTKVPGDKPHNRLVIIEDAHLLTTEAQNAFLKTLEEPPAGTVVILTASHEQALLPTIRSRVQKIVITRPNRTALEAHFGDHEATAIQQVYAISGGLPGLMHALLSDAEHPLKLATERARQLISQPTYERLLVVDELAKQRGLASDICFILQQMAHVALQTTSGAAAAKWQGVLTASYQASEALAANAQPKLALTDLMPKL